MMQDVFQRVGTLPSCRLRLKTRCSGSPSSAAQVLRSQGDTSSGPAAFRDQSFPLVRQESSEGTECNNDSNRAVKELLWKVEGGCYSKIRRMKYAAILNLILMLPVVLHQYEVNLNKRKPLFFLTVEPNP